VLFFVLIGQVLALFAMPAFATLSDRIGHKTRCAEGCQNEKRLSIPFTVIGRKAGGIRLTTAVGFLKTSK
jgi:hypothetical protein